MPGKVRIQAPDPVLLRLAFMITMWQTLFITLFLIFMACIGRFSCIMKNHACPGEGVCPGISSPRDTPGRVLTSGQASDTSK